MKHLYKKIAYILIFVTKLSYGDTATDSNTSPSSNVATTPSAPVTISPSTQGLTQIKNFFDQSTYDDLTTPTSGINALPLSENR